MRVIHRAADLRAVLSGAGECSLVPTMGNLHAGHLSLVSHARTQAGPVVASIFVNPLQFAPTDDFATYPRTLDRDCALLESAGCDIVFAPSESEMYPQPQSYFVQPAPELANMLEGAVRPGFFVGVCTVVLKLLHLVAPRRAYFGKKDYQQLLVIRRMVEQFALPVDIVACETVRETDGLALSSRNGGLSATERARATRLHTTLAEVARQARAGRDDWQALETQAQATLAALPGWLPDYVAIRRQADLGLPAPGEPLVVVAAARLGKVRLIDNVEI